MKKFNFSLENIFKYRQWIEDKKKEKLAKAIEKLRQEQKFLSDLYEERKKRHFALNSSRGVTVSSLQHDQAYLFFLDQRIQIQQGKVKKAQEQVERYRQELKEAAVDKKVLENLRDKRYEEYKYNLKKSEQELLDEVGSTGYCRSAE